MRIHICSSFSSLSSSVKKSCSSSVMLAFSMFTSMAVVLMSDLIFRLILSCGSFSSLDKKSAAVFVEPGMCANMKLNCRT